MVIAFLSLFALSALFLKEKLLLPKVSLPLLLLIYSVLSFLALVGLKRGFARKDGQVKLWDRDVNDN